MATTFLPQGRERSLGMITHHAPALQQSSAISMEETCWNTSVNRLENSWRQLWSLNFGCTNMCHMCQLIFDINLSQHRF
jgi:hypothetical protein